jgi:branched-subunit amino acid transport protein
VPALSTDQQASLVVIALLILANAVVQVAKAIQRKQFRWSRLGEWTVDYLRYVGSALFAAVAAAEAQKYGPSWLSAIATPGFWVVAGSIAVQWLVGRLLANLGISPPAAAPQPPAPPKGE